MVRSKETSMLKTIIAKLLVIVMVLVSVITVTPSESASAKGAPAFTKKVSSILVGKQFDLNISNKITGSTYKWTSSDKKIATVNKYGVVTGVSKGTVTISCTITTPKTTLYLSNKITIRQAAESVEISNEISTVNIGQTYDLNRTISPKSSNDVTSWVSSDSSVIKMGSKGKFTALKEGTAIIIAKTLSGKTDKVTIKVVDNSGLVTNQKELETLLGSGAEFITLKTNAEAEFTIPEGNYSKQTLVVDAPNADVVNYGVFKSVEIKNIKPATWKEEAVGNVLVITADNVRIIIEKDASASVQVLNEGTKLVLVNNGTVKELAVEYKAEISVSGASMEQIPVVANAADAVITTNIPLTLTSNQKISLVILPGAEKTEITAVEEKFIPAISGNVTIEITIGTGTTTETKTVAGTPVQQVTGGFGGGGYIPSPEPSSRTFTLSAPYYDLTFLQIRYSGLIFNISGEMLDTLQGFLSNEAGTLTKWKDTTVAHKVYSGQEITVSGDAGSTTKTVTFDNGLLTGKSYTVSVNELTGAVTITTSANNSYTITKGADNKTLTITNAPDSLVFIG